MRPSWYLLILAVICAVVPAGLPASAAPEVHVTDIAFASQADGFHVTIRADGALAATASPADSGTVVVRLSGAVLPAGFPNFQSVTDPVAASITAQQTTIAPPNALVAIATRVAVAVKSTPGDGGKTLVVVLTAQNAASSPAPVSAVTAAPVAAPSPVTDVPSSPQAALAPLNRTEPGASIIRPSGAGHGHVSLRARGAPIRDVLLDIAEATGATLIVEDDVGGRVTLELADATLEGALHLVLDPRRIRWSRAGTTIVVGHPGTHALPSASTEAKRESFAIPLAHIAARSAVATLRSFFRHDDFRESRDANAVLVSAGERDAGPIRAIVAAIDVMAPSRKTGESIALHAIRAGDAIRLVHSVYPGAGLLAGPNNTVVVAATPVDLASIKALVAGLDVAPAAASQSTEVVRLLYASAPAVARAFARTFPTVRLSANAQTMVISGPAEDVLRAKGIIGAADVPAPGSVTGRLYKLRYASVADVAAALRKAYTGAAIVEDTATNAVAVKGSEGMQAQIATAIGTLDVAPVAGSLGGTATEVVALQNAVPGSGSGSSTSATDMANALTAILGPNAPDLRITVPANTTLLAISGSPSTIRAATDLLRRIDVAPAQLQLDTAVYEVDETAARNIGLQLPNAVVGTTFTENTPQPSAFGTPAPLAGIQKFVRTPISFQAQLNLLMNNGNARVLANPRVTTISGRVATIRAGDNIPYVQTQTSGIVGTVSQTVLTFQTGVTLDITPVANPDGRVSVTLHPIVNTLTGITSQGVPQISSREAQTTVNLHDNETVVIGGLIQESDVDNVSRIPGVSSIPVVGGLFKNKSTNRSRNELVIMVTPHIVGGATVPAER